MRVIEILYPDSQWGFHNHGNFRREAYRLDYSMSGMKYWIALSMVPDVGPVRARKLLSVFGTPGKIFDAKIADLKGLEGIGLHIAKNIKGFSLWKSVENLIGALEQKEIQAVCMNDPAYPEMLRETEDAPVVLYMKGAVLPQDRYSIAIVGSRTMTEYGASIAEIFSRDLVTMGFTVVSGMARGIDSLAHKAALKAGGENHRCARVRRGRAVPSGE